MRYVMPLVLAVLPLSSLLGGCAGLAKETAATSVQTELEVGHDDGQPSERPVVAAPEFEWLVRFDPGLPSYRVSRVRLMVAQPGNLRLTLYRHDETSGRPGAQLAQLVRSYDFAQTSGGRDGKWVIEPIPSGPAVSGAVWLGIAAPQVESGARLWTSRVESEHVFQRDAEPATALQSSRLAFTPLVRLLVEPQAMSAVGPVVAPQAPQVPQAPQMIDEKKAAAPQAKDKPASEAR